MSTARPARDASCPENEEPRLQQIVGAVGRTLRSFADTVRRLCASRAALISMIILVFWLLMSVIGPAIAPMIRQSTTWRTVHGSVPPAPVRHRPVRA